jgi:hypothetical protein
MEVPETRRLTVTERSPDMEGRRTRRALEISRPESRHLTKKCAGEKHCFSDCPQTRKDKAMVLLSEYKKKRDADKKKATLKTLGNNRATADNRDGQTAYLTAEKLGFKVTVLEDTGSYYSAIPRSVLEDARKRGFPLKMTMLPEPIMLNMAIKAKATSRRAVRRRCSCQW